MWFEYLLMSPEDSLTVFSVEYEAQLEFYTFQAIGQNVKVFTQKKGVNVFQHRNFNTFKKLKDFTDRNFMKYDDFWAIGFDVIRDIASVKFKGVTTFMSKFILDEILLREKKLYERRLKMASSSLFNSYYYNDNNDALVMYNQYIFKQIENKFPQNYLSVINDLIKSKKFSIDFLKKYYKDEYDNLLNRFSGRVYD